MILNDAKAIITNFFLCLKSNKSGKELTFKIHSTKKLKIELRRKKVKYLQLNHIHLFVNIFNWFTCFLGYYVYQSKSFVMKNMSFLKTFYFKLILKINYKDICTG